MRNCHGSLLLDDEDEDEGADEVADEPAVDELEDVEEDPPETIVDVLDVIDWTSCVMYAF